MPSIHPCRLVVEPRSTWARWLPLPWAACVVGLGALGSLASSAAAAPDIGFGAIDGLSSVGRVGAFPDGVNALSMTTTACNLGSEDIPWLAPMAESHPVVVMQMYRSADGRFEQVGVSAARHEYFALSGSVCQSCGNPSNGTYLGGGCSTTSGTGVNADRNLLGPRDEIDPYLGTWDCTGSLFSGGQPDCVSRPHDGDGPLDRRLVVSDGDLAVDGAQFVYEAYWLTGGDANRRNNLGSRSVTPVFTGTQWVFSDLNDELAGPALERWGGTQTWVSLPGDGELLLASKSWDLGGGLHQYEYALYNLDSTREVGEVRIPYGESEPTEIGFHDPNGDPGDDWTFQLAGGEVVWSTDPESVDPDAPALSYGLLYNYRFVSEAPPVDGIVTLVAWRSTGEDEVFAGAVVPTGAPSSAPDLTGRHRPADPFQLSCRPLPIQGSAQLSFRLERERSLELSVFDAGGRLVRNLLRGRAERGLGRVRWDGRDDEGRSVAPGVYYVRLQTMDGSSNIQVPVVR